MKLKLRERELPPVQLRLALPAVAKRMLDRYVAFVGQTSGRDVEARQIAVEMLEQFMAGDRDFRRWQKLALRAFSSRTRTGSRKDRKSVV